MSPLKQACLVAALFLPAISLAIFAFAAMFWVAAWSLDVVKHYPWPSWVARP